jgi:hypothetical protein
MTEPLLDTWYTTPHGDFKIEKKRFGTFRSLDREGNGLVTGATLDAVWQMTPFHLKWHVEGYTPPNWLDKSEIKSYDGIVGGKL